MTQTGACTGDHLSQFSQIESVSHSPIELGAAAAADLMKIILKKLEMTKVMTGLMQAWFEKCPRMALTFDNCRSKRRHFKLRIKDMN
jgi:hypothetical protein